MENPGRVLRLPLRQPRRGGQGRESGSTSGPAASPPTPPFSKWLAVTSLRKPDRAENLQKGLNPRSEPSYVHVPPPDQPPSHHRMVNVHELPQGALWGASMLEPRPEGFVLYMAVQCVQLDP